MSHRNQNNDTDSLDLETDLPWLGDVLQDVSSSGDASSVLPPVTGRNADLKHKNGDFFYSSSSPKQHSRHSIPVTHVDDTDCESSIDTNLFDVRCLFRNAEEYIQPGRFFRWIVYLFGERKLMVFFLVHLVGTLIIWLHFFLVKFEQQKETIPDTANYYWWKRLMPPIEFGSMHAILFQMALLPLTMARFTISQLSGTVLDRFIPLNRTLRMHIHLGYTMVIIVLVATIFFFAFFGLLCRNGEPGFCDKFTSEIMATGYGILASLLIVLGTSHFRHKIPYEVFYVVHHLVFIMYAITVAHTFDIEQRRNRAQRSQTFKWFSATIMYYVCDRVAAHLNHKYRTRLVSSSTIHGSNGSKMIILNLKRPALFRFAPGQYAYLRIAKIDIHWHPFSISSDPSSDSLEFYAEVFASTSWTGKLWGMLEDHRDCDYYRVRPIEVEIMGPFGTPLAKTDDYSHVLAIGTGTGIVPVLSLFKQQVHQLLRLDSEAHFAALEKHRNKIHEVEMAEDSRKGSFAKLLVRAIKCNRFRYQELKEYKLDTVRESIRDSIARRTEVLSNKEVRRIMSRMKRAAFEASRSIYSTVLLSMLPVFGIALIGLMISWNTNIQPYDCMVIILKAATIVFQAFFVVVAIFVWDARGLLAYVDLAFSLITPFADWYWFIQCQKHMTLETGDLFLYSLLTTYMVIRVWSQAVIPKHRSWKTRVEDEGVRTTERFDMVWVAREASLVSEILPDINATWQQLVNAWGDTNVKAVCRVSIYVTDKDKKSQAILENEFQNTSLYRAGSIHFGRPNFATLIQDHTIELVSSRRYSHSLLAYVGSPDLAKEIHHCKISNDMVTAITGHTTHDMDFVSESYGGARSKKAKTKTTVIPLVDNSPVGPSSPMPNIHLDSQVLSIRKTTSYEEKGNHLEETDEVHSGSETSLFTTSEKSEPSIA